MSFYLSTAINIWELVDMRLSGPAHSPPGPAPQEYTDHLNIDTDGFRWCCAWADESRLFRMNLATASARLDDNSHCSFSVSASGARPRTYILPGFPLVLRCKSWQNSVRNVIADLSSSALPGEKWISVTVKLACSAVSRELVVVIDCLSSLKIRDNSSALASMLLLSNVSSGSGT